MEGRQLCVSPTPTAIAQQQHRGPPPSAPDRHQVTLRGIEETAARILKILNDRRGASSPQWVDSFHAKERAAAAAAQQRDAAQQSGLEGLGPEVTIPELVYGNAVDSSYLMQGLY